MPDSLRVECAAPKQVYLNETFRITYRIYGNGKFQAPDFGDEMISTWITEIGHDGQPVEKKYSYWLVSAKPRVLHFLPAIYTIAGNRIESEPLTIQVLDEDRNPVYYADTINASTNQMVVVYPTKVPLDMSFTVDYCLNDTVADFYSFGRIEKVKSYISIFDGVPEKESYSECFSFYPRMDKKDGTISYTYRCYPEKTGFYQIPPAVWSKGGKEILRSKPLDIEITAPTDEWKSFFVRREVESTNVPLGEPFQVVYKLYTKYTSLNFDAVKPKFPDSQIEYLPIPKDMERGEDIYEGEEYYTFTILKAKVTPLASGVFEGGEYSVTCSPKGASHLKHKTLLPSFQYYVHKNLLK